MKLWEILHFEIACQSRRVSTWLYAAALLGLTWTLATHGSIHNARTGGYFLNAPFVIATVTLLGGIMGLLMASGLAGDAAARDVQTRMHPLVYTTPVGKGTWLRARFLAAFVLNVLILAAVQAGLLLAALMPGAGAGLLGPFRPAAFLSAWLFLALPNAFVATAFQFSLAALARRAMASYLGSLVLLLLTLVSWQILAGQTGWRGPAKLLDPFGLTVLSEMSRSWTPVEKNTVLVGPQGWLIANRLLWSGVAFGALMLALRRFRIAHHTAGSRLSRGARPRGAHAAPRGAPLTVPPARRTFGLAAHARQALGVSRQSFREIVMGWGGLALAAPAVITVLFGPELMKHMGVPLFPTTTQITAYLVNPQDLIWMLIPLVIVFHAGELVWREREEGSSAMVDTAPAPDWAFFLGRFMGLGFALAAMQALMMAAGMILQARLGYHDFEIGLYIRILFGLQLPDYLLFALLALAVHVVVDHKHLGHMVVILASAVTAFSQELGIEHKLLVYGSAPGWAHSDMRGFGPFPGPWVVYKLYWAGWALLLAVGARLLWVRGAATGLVPRLRLARRRFTGPAAGAAATAAGIILTLGGFIFYNTNVLNAYTTASDRLEQRAAYERRYGQYRDLPQPQVTGVRLHMEIHPRRREAEIRGRFLLLNRTATGIRSVHLATSPDVETLSAEFDRPATAALADKELGHRIYDLETPLQPGDSVGLEFEVRFKPRGFTNEGIDASVAANGTYVAHQAWLPAIGYQPVRELQGAGDRRAHGLAARPEVRPLEDVPSRHETAGGRIAFEAVMGTEEGQVAVAPGTLRRTWTQNGRRYFHYATDAPIRSDYALFSANYAVRESRWNDVSIQILHHPGHAWNIDRMVRGVQASLACYTRRFGPYPHRQIRLVEHPGDGTGLHSAPVNISYEEGFSLFNPDDDPRGVDFPFAIVAHEVAHQWWGNQVTPAFVEGGAVLTESLAWYSAMAVVEETYGREHLGRLLGLLREAYLTPRARAGVPLLRAADWFTAYRKGPFAMYAVREYVGDELVAAALRRLVEKHGAGAPPLPTSLDLYEELRRVTPDSLRPLLADLFEANTWWELAAERVSAEPGEDGTWQVTLDVRARKVVVDRAGEETEVPMDNPVEVGVYGAALDGGPGELLDLRLHRVRSGSQRITVTVPAEPARAGIDPRHLLIDAEAGDNVAEIAWGFTSRPPVRAPGKP